MYYSNQTRRVVLEKTWPKKSWKLTYHRQTELLASNSIHLVSFTFNEKFRKFRGKNTKSHLGVCRVELNIAGYHFLATIHMQTYFLKAYVFFWFFFPFQNTACHSFSTFKNRYFIAGFTWCRHNIYFRWITFRFSEEIRQKFHIPSKT